MNKIPFTNWAKSLSLGLFFFLYTLFSLAFENEPLQMQRCALSAKTKQNKSVDITKYSGDFSSPAEVRALENQVRDFHLKKMFAEADNKGKEQGETDLFSGYLATSVLQNSYKRFGQIREEWQTPVDSYGFYGTLISSKKINELKKQGVHESEIYGTKAVLDHKLTHMLIDKTPLNFRLNKEMWAEAHRLGAKSANPLWQNLGFYAYPLLRPLSLHDAVYKGGGNYRDSFNLLGLYRSRLYDEMSPKELETILGVYDQLVNLGVLPKIEDKKQEKLWRIVEDHPYIPFYKRNKELPNGNRAVTLSYPSAKILEQAMEHVFDWVNKEMDLIDNNLPGARDPIELAAITQFAMVYLHAAKDGNGRVSKHFKNLILKKYGLPMDLRYESDSMPEFSIPHWKDLSLGLAEHVRQTRLGVFYKVQEASNVQVGKAASIENAKVGIEIHKTDSLRYLAEAIDSENSNNRNVLKKAQQYFSYISDLAVPANVKQIFTFGTTEIKDLVFKGHFFEGKQRVLYTYDPKTNSLYPIGDWASVLYGLGTGVFQKNTGRNTYTFRKKNAAFERELKNNYALFVRTMQDPKFANSVKVVSYDTVAAKNRGLGELFLHDFQLDLVKEALAVYDPAHPEYINPKDYPVAVMSPNRGNEKKVSRSGPTVMQLSFVKGDVDKVSPGVAMSAFQLRRTFLRQIEMGLQKNHPQTYQEVKHLIEHARKANYEAAKVLLKDFK
ncbi:MAG: Fic family protein, partial [Bdellovibrionota bacterium]|nr:Fic family protein [Bdellovibrionota bacterium]